MFLHDSYKANYKKQVKNFVVSKSYTSKAQSFEFKNLRKMVQLFFPLISLGFISNIKNFSLNMKKSFDLINYYKNQG